MKKTIAVLLVLLMVFSLAACGGDKGGDADDSNRIVIDNYQAMYKGCEIMEDYDGDDALVVTYDFTNKSKDPAAFFWSIFYTASQNGQELEMASIFINDDFDSITDSGYEEVAPGDTMEVKSAFKLLNTTDDVAIKYSDLFDKASDSLTIHLSDAVRSQNSGGLKPLDGAEPSEPTEPTGPAEKPTASDDYWSGDWYGWWQITSAKGYWEDLDYCWYDCCARITKYDDANGYIVIWDEDGSGNDEYMVECSVSFGPGVTGDGCMMSESGEFWDDEIEHADWIVDPGASVVSRYDHMICIDGTYEDPENDGGFDYKFYMRPWGMNWEDVAADDTELLPYTYESWYLPAIAAGIDMPDMIGGGGFLSPGEVPDGEMEPQGGDEPDASGGYDPNASAVDGTWQELIYGDYGLSKASATGLVPMTREEFVTRIGFYADSQIGYAPYDSLYNSMGYIHGKPLIDDPRWETGKTHVYQWSIESGEYAVLVFDVTDYDICIEKLRLVETSPGLLS